MTMSQASRYIIRTVTGDVPAESVGIILPHEHIHVDASGIKKDPDARLTSAALAVSELRQYAALGGDVLVEVTPRGVGRNPQLLYEVSVETGLRIVCATGFYFGLYLPWEAYNMSVDELEELFVRELTAGIDGTPIRAGVIGEIGTSGPILPAERRVFQAAARAQRRVGCGIITHTQFGRDALEQVRMLADGGANLSQVAVGHMDLYPDLAYHKEVAATGVFLAYDNIGRVDYRPDEDRLRLVLAMLEAGFGDQVLLSQDISRLSHLTRSHGHGYGHLLQRFVPMLRQSGVDDDTIRKLLVDNPRRLLQMPAGDGE